MKKFLFISLVIGLFTLTGCIGNSQTEISKTQAPECLEHTYSNCPENCTKECLRPASCTDDGPCITVCDERPGSCR